jgi:hypothetical protein
MWHCREDQLAPGAIIQPGRWGSVVRSQGQQHPYFYRELLLDERRRNHSTVALSRWSCSFAFADRSEAVRFSGEGHGSIMSVEPADPTSQLIRLDMLWLTWIGGAGASDADVEWAMDQYWAGAPSTVHRSDAQPSWEWLVGGPLRVIAEAPGLG